MPRNLLTFVLVTAFFASGCLLAQKGTKEPSQQEQVIKDRKEKFDALNKRMKAGTLAAGTAAEEIRREFGAPDDVFQSGSATGNFEVWTYRQLNAKGGETDTTITLYFDRESLASWRY